jgi:macrolide transport system ATP-binding/permease protein
VVYKMYPLIELRNISREFKAGDSVVKALQDINLTIYHGEFVSIMGQSGSGKSTLMNVIGCLDRPSAGQYLVNGMDVSTFTSDELATLRRDCFGFIFQRYNLLATSSASENIEIPAVYAGLSKPVRFERAQQLLEKLGIGDRADHLPNQLSGGQQQRVAIARALMNSPSVILADEPTGALDSRSGEEVMALLKQLNAEGNTIILITHDEKVAAHATRQIRIQDGRIISDIGQMTPPTDMADDHIISEEKEFLTTTSTAEEAVKTAVRALRVNIFRTSLTLLGIVIGVAAVITMLAVGNGSKQRVLQQISSMGTNLLSVRPGAPGVRNSGDNATLTMDDAKALESIANIDAVVAERSSSKTVRFGNKDTKTTITAVGSSFPYARDWPVEKGNFFSLPDLSSYTPVAVIGTTVVGSLFPLGENPIGQYILIGNIPFEVIGIMKSKGAAPWGQDQDDVIFVPITTGLARLFGSTYLSGVTIRVNDTKIIENTQDQITKTISDRHHTEDFSVRNTASFLEMANETQNTLTILLGTVAAISLLVGGIGVMNIMLVSVTERTREIGIRMATGARIRDILIQFNTESAVVCTIGGILGVAIGFLTGGILSLFGVNILFTFWPAVLAFACAIATGLIFGYLPARKAAMLDPVIALSSE